MKAGIDSQPTSEHFALKAGKHRGFSGIARKNAEFFELGRVKSDGVFMLFSAENRLFLRFWFKIGRFWADSGFTENRGLLVGVVFF